MRNERARYEDELQLPASDPQSLGDRVYAELSSAIVEGRLAPGERLSDKEIAEVIGISRTPVREAIQRLALVGLVEVSASRFTRVTEVSDDLAESTLEFVVAQAGIAVHFAVRRMSDAELAEGIALLDRMIEASTVDDLDRIVVASREFIVLTRTHCRNPVLARIMQNENAVLERNLRRSRFKIGTAEQRRGPLRHLRIAMLARDADAAEHWFRVLCAVLGAAGVGVSGRGNAAIGSGLATEARRGLL